MLPVSRDAQVFVEQSTQELRVFLVLRTADLANTGERAECAGVSLSPEHHRLVRVDVHGNVLVHAGQRHKRDVNQHWVDLIKTQGGGPG